MNCIRFICNWSLFKVCIDLIVLGRILFLIATRVPIGAFVFQISLQGSFICLDTFDSLGFKLSETINASMIFRSEGREG